MKDTPEEFAGICDYCKRKGEKASKATGYKGITLLSPEGYWICERCINIKTNELIIGGDP